MTVPLVWDNIDLCWGQYMGFQICHEEAEQENGASNAQQSLKESGAKAGIRDRLCGTCAAVLRVSDPERAND
jgi:hypothetical protein